MSSYLEEVRDSRDCIPSRYLPKLAFYLLCNDCRPKEIMIAATYIAFPMCQVLLHILIHSILETTYEGRVTIVPILQMRILNHGGVK